MTSDQTPLAEEDHKMQLKALEKAGTVRGHGRFVKQVSTCLEKTCNQLLGLMLSFEFISNIYFLVDLINYTLISTS